MTQDTLIARLYAASDGNTDRRLDALFDYVDDRLLEGRFDEVDALLRALDCARLGISMVVGVLSITCAAKPELIARAGFVQRAEARLRALDPSRVEGLMSGLR